MKKELVISRSRIQSRIKELARQISSDYQGSEIVLVGILNGAVFFFVDLIKELTIPSRIDFIRAFSYGSGTSSSGTIQFTKDIEIPVANRHVLVVEDIVDTGLTLKEIVERLKKDQPESVKICALIDKHERREEQLRIDYHGFRIDEGFLVGYGLDYDEQYRYLPDIYALK